MKLAVFYPQFEAVGGAEILVAAHARFFRSQGLDVGLVTGSYRAEIWASRLDGVPVHAMPAPGSLLGRAYRRLASPELRLERWATEALAGWDAVVAHNFPTGAILGRSDIPARKIWHCNEPTRWLFLREANPYLCSRLGASKPHPVPRALPELERKLLGARLSALAHTRNARHRALDLDGIPRIGEIWANSEYTRDAVAAAFGRYDARVVYPMVQFPAAGPRRSGLQRSAPQVLTHSRLESLKNIDTVLRGFACFHRRIPSARLHVVGDGPQRAALGELARGLSIADAVTFHGFLPDAQLEQIYAQCELFALVPFDEPFGMVFPEAAARGLLLVGPDHGGPFEILEGGKLGAVVDACSVEALGDAMERAFRLDDAEADRTRERTAAACLARFGTEAVGRRLMELLGR